MTEQEIDISENRDKSPPVEVVNFLLEHGIDTLEKVEVLLGPNLYAIIPINILENKELSANSKLLYAEVMALSKKSGKCFATNEYLANRLGLSPRTIPALLQELNGCGVIHTDIKRDKRGTYRNITISFFSDGGHRSITRRGIAISRGHNRNRQIEIDNKNTDIVESKIPQVFFLEDELKKWESGTVRRMDILAWFIRKKKLTPDSMDKLRDIKDRHIKAAQRLEKYTDSEIVIASKEASKIEGWTLETILKYLTK